MIIILLFKEWRILISISYISIITRNWMIKNECLLYSISVGLFNAETLFVCKWHITIITTYIFKAPSQLFSFKCLATIKSCVGDTMDVTTKLLAELKISWLFFLCIGSLCTQACWIVKFHCFSLFFLSLSSLFLFPKMTYLTNNIKVKSQTRKLGFLKCTVLFCGPHCINFYLPII